MEGLTKQLPVYQTTHGQVLLQHLSSIKLCLFHECLNAKVSQFVSNRSLTLENYQYHLENPDSLQNTSVTSTMLQHELQALIQQNGIKHNEVLLLDGSSYYVKVPEIFQKYQVMKGYNYRIGQVSETQKSALMNEQYILKQIDYEFKLGNGTFRPGFIGQLTIQECLNQREVFSAYLTYAKETGCPIIINNIDKQAVSQQLFLANSQKHIELDDFYKKIEILVKMVRQKSVKSVVLYNLPMQIVIQVDQSTHHVSNSSHLFLAKLLQEGFINLGFDISRYSQNSNAMIQIGRLIRSYSNRIILSQRLRYKTDLKLFGGKGYNLYEIKGSDLLIENHLLNQVLVINKLNLLRWKKKKQTIKLVVLWKCVSCGKEQQETVQSFRKMGLQFCSIKCLKSYKF